MKTSDQETGWVRVWDPLVRSFHWGLALSFLAAWLSANAWENVHIWAGFAAGGLIVLRVAWGFIGTPYARFSQFVHPPRHVVDTSRRSHAAARPAISGTTRPEAP